MDDTQGPTVLGPGRSRGGLPLKIRVDVAQYRALERIAAERNTTPAGLVEALVLNALSHVAVPAAAPSIPKRPHTTDETATRDFTRDLEDGAVEPV